MNIGSALRYTAAAANPQTLDKFCQHIPSSWISLALGVTGKATVRKRKLPAELVVWLVVGMGLFRNRAISHLVESLDLVLPDADGSREVASSAVTEARARLGAEPVEWLFHATGKAWGRASAEAHRWRGLSVHGMDGTTMRVADTPENREHFGGSNSRRGVSGYPLVRLVVLMALRSHLLLAARFGPSTASEMKYALDLVPLIPDDSLSVLDRAYLGAAFLCGLNSGGRNRHWLTRTKLDTRLTGVRSLGKNDRLVDLQVSEAARRKDPLLPETMRLRAIRYQRKGFRPQQLLTSLLDAKKYPATELVDLYHERWELELGYDEIKTEMLEREETIRSRSPETVAQEVWGVLLAFNLVRRHMEHVANELGVEPTRISFIEALHLIRDEFIWLAAASAGAIPGQIGALNRNLSRHVLPRRRSTRQYPRAVKIKMTTYLRKRPVTTTTSR